MAPRERETWVAEEDGYDDRDPSKWPSRPPPSSASHLRSRRPLHSSLATSRGGDIPRDDDYRHSPEEGKKGERRRRAALRVGGLRFGLHGLSGVASTVLLLLCLAHHHHGHGPSPTPSPPPWYLLVSSMLLSSIVASTSRPLLSQVPQSTRISAHVVPPHREAFKRTAAVVTYLNLRLAGGRGWLRWGTWRSLRAAALGALSIGGGDGNLASADIGADDDFDVDRDDDLSDLAFVLGLLAFHARRFFPGFRPDWKNGNTWIFVFPIWIGLGIDAMMQFPSLVLLNGTDGTDGGAALSWLGIYSQLPADDRGLNLTLSWDSSRRWNCQVIDERYLLLTMTSTMAVAFLFTLAFRGILVDVKSCYWISAATVAALAARVILSATTGGADDSL